MRYVTRDECIEREVIEPLREYAADFDIEAIADEVVETDENGLYYTPCDVEEFWRVVEKYDISATR